MCVMFLTIDYLTQYKKSFSIKDPIESQNEPSAQPFSHRSFLDKITQILDNNTTKPQLGIAKLPTYGEPNENCGEISAFHKCQTCAKSYPLLHSCHRLECPTCYKSAAAARIGARASKNIRANIEALLATLGPTPATDIYGKSLQNASLYDPFYKEDPERKRLYQILKHGGLRHMVISLPPELCETWGKYPHKTMVKKFNQHLKTYVPNLIAASWFYHPARIQEQRRKQFRDWRERNPERIIKILKRDKDEIKINPYNTKKFALRIDEPETATYGRFGYWEDVFDDVLCIGKPENYTYFSPHFHVLYIGAMPRADYYYQQTDGWVYKNVNNGKPIPWNIEQTEGKPFTDHVAKVATYLASHAGLYETVTGKTHDSVHYTKLFSPKATSMLKDLDGKNAILKIYKTFVDCPECGPGNHLELCNKETQEPIIGPNGVIYAQDKITIPKKKLTPYGEKLLQGYLNYNWAVSRDT